MVNVYGVPAWMMAKRFRHVDDPAIDWAWEMVKDSDIFGSHRHTVDYANRFV